LRSFTKEAPMIGDERIEQSNRQPRTDADPPEVVGRVDDDHQTLRAKVDALRQALTAPDRVSPQAFAAQVESLAAQLESHFALEEDSGMFVDITSQVPELGHRVQRLLNQHVELRAAFADILERLRARQDVAAALTEALDDLVAHERSETQLIQDAYLTDLGRGD
jgi:uncharacterized protein involved in exopolysaccharide biosynthesis